MVIIKMLSNTIFFQINLVTCIKTGIDIFHQNGSKLANMVKSMALIEFSRLLYHPLDQDPALVLKPLLKDFVIWHNPFYFSPEFR